MKQFKKFCKIKKKECKFFAPIVKALKKNPSHICKKCKVKSSDKSKLCKPEKLK